MKQDIRTKLNYTIGIDPDVEKNGVAIVEKETRHLECAALTFAETLDYLQWVVLKQQGMKALTDGRPHPPANGSRSICWRYEGIATTFAPRNKH